MNNMDIEKFYNIKYFNNKHHLTKKNHIQLLIDIYNFIYNNISIKS